MIDRIDTPGGHILVCLALIIIGAAMWKLGVPKSEDIIVGASAVAFAAMRGRGGAQ